MERKNAISNCSPAPYNTKQPHRYLKVYNPMSKIQSGRAVAPILAVLLLVAVSAVGGMVVFVWAGGELGRMAGTAPPSVESLQLIGYDARDAPALTGFDILDNNSDLRLSADGTYGEFIVLKVRNTGISDMLIRETNLMGVSHTWDSGADTTTAPGNGKFEIYEGLNNEPSQDKISAVIAPGEDARIATRLGDVPGDEVKLGRNLPVTIKTEQGATFNFSVLTGTEGGSTLPGSPSPPSEPTCNGLTATIIGTSNSDSITGTSANDVIVSLGGSDVINGSSGNDVICAGDGNDTIDSSSGADIVYGGDGDDTINASSGNDTVYGGNGDDIIDGSSGSDICNGGAGNDSLTSCEQVTG